MKKECECSLRTKLVGDGCEVCNPAFAIDLLKETLAELTEERDELVKALRMALEWIDAVPSDTQLPTMPGFDRDYVNDLLSRLDKFK